MALLPVLLWDPSVLWIFSKTRNPSLSDSEAFQIPWSEGSLVLKFFDYPKAKVINYIKEPHKNPCHVKEWAARVRFIYLFIFIFFKLSNFYDKFQPRIKKYSVFFFFLFRLSYLVCSQIWLNYFLDDCHFGYITKSLKRNPERGCSKWGT